MDPIIGGALIQGGASLIGLPIQAAIQKKSEERQHKYNKEAMAIQQGYAKENATQAQAWTMQNMATAQQYNQDNARLQQQLNEESAINAHNRNLQMYEQTQSTRAKVAEMEKAGLSIGLINGTPSAGGASSGGTASTSVSGMSAPSGPMAPTGPMGVTQALTLDIMNTMNNLGSSMANIAKTIQETKVLGEQEHIENLKSSLYDLEADMKKWEWDDKLTEWYIKHSNWYNNETKENTSITELAMSHNTFEDFMKSLKTDDPGLRNELASEYGRQMLHNIYNTAHQLKVNNIGMLYNEKNIKFQEDVMEAMKNQDFAKMSAKSQRQFLEANIATNELTATQKDAWNKLLDKIGNEDIKNGLIVLAMIVNQMAGSWHMPNMSTYNTNNYVNQ